MRQRLLWIFLTGLLIAVVVFVVGRNDVTLGRLSSGDSVWLFYKIALLVFIGAGVFIMSRGRFVKALAAALLWIVLAPQRVGRAAADVHFYASQLAFMAARKR